MINSMPLFQVLKNGRFVGEIAAVSLKQAVKRAHARHGRCEVIGVNIARHADRFTSADGQRSEGRKPCNDTLAGKARIDAIRLAAIAEWQASQ